MIRPLRESLLIVGVNVLNADKLISESDFLEITSDCNNGFGENLAEILFQDVYALRVVEDLSELRISGKFVSSYELVLVVIIYHVDPCVSELNHILNLIIVTLL